MSLDKYRRQINGHKVIGPQTAYGLEYLHSNGFAFVMKAHGSISMSLDKYRRQMNGHITEDLKAHGCISMSLDKYRSCINGHLND